LIDIDNFFSTMSSLCHRCATAQEVVNWVTTADGCVHTTNSTSQLANLSRLVETVAKTC